MTTFWIKMKLLHQNIVNSFFKGKQVAMVIKMYLSKPFKKITLSPIHPYTMYTGTCISWHIEQSLNNTSRPTM